jgi:hypothetical protein
LKIQLEAVRDKSTISNQQKVKGVVIPVSMNDPRNRLYLYIAMMASLASDRP